MMYQHLVVLPKEEGPSWQWALPRTDFLDEHTLLSCWLPISSQQGRKATQGWSSWKLGIKITLLMYRWLFAELVCDIIGDSKLSIKYCWILLLCIQHFVSVLCVCFLSLITQLKDLKIKIIWAWLNAEICVYEEILDTEQGVLQILTWCSLRVKCYLESILMHHWLIQMKIHSSSVLQTHR